VKITSENIFESNEWIITYIQDTFDIEFLEGERVILIILN